jgi:hypothetical protein
MTKDSVRFILSKYKFKEVDWGKDYSSKEKLNYNIA